MRELTVEETNEVSGAADAAQIAAGAALITLGIGIVATGGLAAVPISLLGAATGGELLLAGSALALSGSGGYLIGSGICY